MWTECSYYVIEYFLQIDFALYLLYINLRHFCKACNNYIISFILFSINKS